MVTSKTEEPAIRHPDVASAVAAVMGEMSPIKKGERYQSKSGAGYSYRGIEQVTAALQPLLSKHGLVFYPHAELVETREILVNNNPWTDSFVRVTYDISVAGSSDKEQVVVYGIGRDNSDKGVNKAMTQAFKYCLLQVFCISDRTDDGDAEVHETQAFIPRERINDEIAGLSAGDLSKHLHDAGLSLGGTAEERALRLRAHINEIVEKEG